MNRGITILRSKKFIFKIVSLITDDKSIVESFAPELEIQLPESYIKVADSPYKLKYQFEAIGNLKDNDISQH
ncbi:MAG: hypothetical protein IPI30_12540 [Saprospiraceae bacterium]|nr:hypothetical protein [Candidatus Vicinibacter affinis]